MLDGPVTKFDDGCWLDGACEIKVEIANVTIQLGNSTAMLGPLAQDPDSTYQLVKQEITDESKDTINLFIAVVVLSIVCGTSAIR